jgi:hypothetical protein
MEKPKGELLYYYLSVITCKNAEKFARVKHSSSYADLALQGHASTLPGTEIPICRFPRSRR